MNYQLAQMGNPGAPNPQQYANNQTDLITGGANAQAGSQLAAGDARAGAVNSLGQIGAGAAQDYFLNQPGQPVYQPGYGMPPYRR
jgi:hypothetical protein